MPFLPADTAFCRERADRFAGGGPLRASLAENRDALKGFPVFCYNTLHYHVFLRKHGLHLARKSRRGIFRQSVQPERRQSDDCPAKAAHYDGKDASELPAKPSGVI